MRAYVIFQIGFSCFAIVVGIAGFNKRKPSSSMGVLATTVAFQLALIIWGLAVL